MENGVYRYSLVVKNNETKKEHIIRLNERDKKESDKGFLTTIDSRTTDFANETELINYLKNGGYINFTDGEVYITYRISRKTNALNIIYQDQVYLREIAKKYKHKTYINENDQEFKKTFQEFMINIQKGPFYRFMIEKKYINERLKQLLEDYLYKGNILRERDIIREVSRYKAFRSYVLGKQHYEGKINLKLPRQVSENFPFKQMEIDLDKYKNNNGNDTNSDSPRVKINSDDDFLNGLETPDEILGVYDLEQLERIKIEGKSLFDGLGEVKAEETKTKIKER